MIGGTQFLSFAFSPLMGLSHQEGTTLKQLLECSEVCLGFCFVFFLFFHLLRSSEINLPNFDLIYLYRLICKLGKSVH